MLTDPRLSLELWTLLAAVFLGLVHLSAASFSFKAQVGNRYTVGPRDEGLQPEKMAGRLHRAAVNFRETFTYFAVCVIVAHIADALGPFSRWGCLLYLGGRVAYLPLYAVGIPWLRTFSWNIATFGLVLVGIQILVSISS